MPFDIKDRDKAERLTADITQLELRAHKLGLHATARALNNAKNATGWEMAGDVITAAKAGRGQRPGEDYRP